MKKEFYFVESPNMMTGGELKKLTAKEAEELRRAGYTVTR